MKLSIDKVTKTTFKTLRFILGDQLNNQHSWYRKTNENILYVMMEVRQETDYTQHHIQKIVGFFLAMRAFSMDLAANGHRVIYFTIDDARNLQDIFQNITQLIQQFQIQHFEYQLPGCIE